MDGAYHLTISASVAMPRGYQKERIMEKVETSMDRASISSPDNCL